MKCPACGGEKLVPDTRDMPYSYKGESTILPAVVGEFCPACDEAVLDLAESVRTSALMMAFNKQTNAAIVDPEFISGIRKKLALDQREAAVQNDVTRGRHGDGVGPLELGQGARDGFDGQAEVVGDVGS